MRILLLITFVLGGSKSLAEEKRLPTIREVLAIAELVRHTPPWVSDVTVLVEFSLEPISEEQLRNEVRKSISSDDADRKLDRSSAEVEKEVEQEVQRLMVEQSLPRRAKERWRRDGLSYRVDEARTRTGLEVIDEDTPWQKSFAYLLDKDSNSFTTFKLDWSQKIVSVFSQRHGNVRAFRDVWQGGTLGKFSVGVRAALGMSAFPSPDDESPNMDYVQQLADGKHPQVRWLVDKAEDQKKLLHFSMLPKNGGEVSFAVAKDQLTSVLEMQVRDATNELVFSMNVDRIAADGVVREWTEHSQDPRSGKLRQLKFQVLDSKFGEALPADTFDASQRPGWVLADHRPETSKVLDVDGTPIPIGRSGSKRVAGRSLLPLVLFCNAVLLLIFGFWWHRRQHPPESSD